VSGDVPDYQPRFASGPANSVTPHNHGLNAGVAHSGRMMDLHDVVTLPDKTKNTTVLPTVAACGLPVGKIWGVDLPAVARSIGESIPGYRKSFHRLKTTSKKGVVFPVNPGSGACRWQIMRCVM
jgi:hypothetical protein